MARARRWLMGGVGWRALLCGCKRLLQFGPGAGRHVRPGLFDLPGQLVQVYGHPAAARAFGLHEGLEGGDGLCVAGVVYGRLQAGHELHVPGLEGGFNILLARQDVALHPGLFPSVAQLCPVLAQCLGLLGHLLADGGVGSRRVGEWPKGRRVGGGSRQRLFEAVKTAGVALGRAGQRQFLQAFLLALACLRQRNGQGVENGRRQEQADAFFEPGCGRLPGTAPPCAGLDANARRTRAWFAHAEDL